MPLKPNGWTDPPADLLDHIDGLFSYALILTRNNNQAVTLVQETYDCAFEAMKRRGISSNIKSWMFTTLRKIWLSGFGRRYSPPGTNSIGEENCNMAEMSKKLHVGDVDRIECLKVREAIEQLPLDFREVILLREYAELSFQEIAKILNCTVGTVTSRLAGARSKLRMLLSGILHMQGASTAFGKICETTVPT